ncbi:hypothetical protein [Variovorax sp. UC74_104]
MFANFAATAARWLYSMATQVLRLGEFEFLPYKSIKCKLVFVRAEID